MLPPRLYSGDMTESEQLVRSRMGELPFDFEAMSCVANIHRAAMAFRGRVERELLAEYKISWSGFAVLFVLWVWGPTEANKLAQDVGVTNPTLTGLVSTLEGRGLVERLTPNRDRRKTVVSLTDSGLATIEELFPRFHAYEVQATADISYEDQQQVSSALRSILRWSEGPSTDGDDIEGGAGR